MPDSPDPAMIALTEAREREEAASGEDRWLAVSAPLAVDDDPDWDEPLPDPLPHEPGP